MKNADRSQQLSNKAEWNTINSFNDLQSLSIVTQDFDQ